MHVLERKKKTTMHIRILQVLMPLKHETHTSSTNFRNYEVQIDKFV
jgi:hypothetical protein